jgi:hypothetical protein
MYILLAIAMLAYGYISEQQVFEPGKASPRGAASAVQQAYEQQKSDVQVQGKGIVSRVLLPCFFSISPERQTVRGFIFTITALDFIQCFVQRLLL